MLDPEEIRRLEEEYREQQAQHQPVPSILRGRGVSVETDFSKWICLYPAYIDSKKSIAEGRKIGKNHCIEDPHVMEMAEATNKIGLLFVVEDKAYSRDCFIRGRLRVNLFEKSEATTKLKSPLDGRFPTKKALMRQIAEIMPSLETRERRLEQIAAAQKRAQAKSASTSSTVVTKSKKKKK
eukprot:Selendium_serpulae@DN4944_c0_g1_i1.p1